MAVKKAEGAALKFSKEQLLLTKRYEENKDIVNAVLTSDTDYTFEEVDELIDRFMKGKVK